MKVTSLERLAASVCCAWITSSTVLVTTAAAFGVLPLTTAKPSTVVSLADSLETTASPEPALCESSNNDKNDNMSSSAKLRSVRKIMARPPAHWVGDGFRVYPVFANSAFTQELSPLLMFDYAEPKQFPARVGPPLGVGQHPHRGFETVTVAFQGEVEHQDSTGQKDVIGEGDVQWMTAGRGIIHQEFHSHEFTRSGGTFEMCQLWVNLPKQHKMTKPGYQALLKQNIPVVNLPLNSDSNDSVGTARIIAGELGDTKGAASTFSPVQMWDINLPKAGSEVDLPFPASQNCIVFVRRGAIQVVSSTDHTDYPKLKESSLGPQDVALMRVYGSDTVRLRVVDANSSVLILGGEPLNEPIVNQGPFVMNTQEEIHKAISDYRLGKMGK